MKFYSENILISDSDSDTLVTAAASIFDSNNSIHSDLNRMNASFQETNLIKCKNSHSRSSSSSGSSDTLIDTVSIASSCPTYFSQDGDAYRCARGNLNRKRLKKTKAKAHTEVKTTFISR